MNKSDNVLPKGALPNAPIAQWEPATHPSIQIYVGCNVRWQYNLLKYASERWHERWHVVQEVE